MDDAAEDGSRAPEEAASVEPGAGAPEPPDEDGDEGRWTKNLGVLDLSRMRSRDEARRLRLTNIGLVLVPEDMPDLLAGAACKNLGAVVPVPPGTRIENRTGQMELAGEALAAGDPETILAVAGQIVITPPVTSVGYRGLVLVGQIFVPRSGQGALSARTLHVGGQLFPYDDDARPRIFIGAPHLTRAFFEAGEEPMTLVLIGGGLFAADVTPDVLRHAVRSAVLIGGAAVENPDLAPVLQYLARTQLGAISVAEKKG